MHASVNIKKFFGKNGTHVPKLHRDTLALMHLMTSVYWKSGVRPHRCISLHNPVDGLGAFTSLRDRAS